MNRLLHGVTRCVIWEAPRASWILGVGLFLWLVTGCATPLRYQGYQAHWSKPVLTGSMGMPARTQDPRAHGDDLMEWIICPMKHQPQYPSWIDGVCI